MIRPAISPLWRHLTVILLSLLLGTGLVVIINAAPSAPPGEPTVALYTAQTETELCEGDDACGLVSLQLTSTRDGAGSILCVDITTGTLLERGCADVSTSVRVDTETGIWATLPTTSLTMYSLTCDEHDICRQSPGRVIDIRAEWATEGPASGTGRMENACARPGPTEGSVRHASIDLSINGDNSRAFGTLRLIHAVSISDCDGQ